MLKMGSMLSRDSGTAHAMSRVDEMKWREFLGERGEVGEQTASRISYAVVRANHLTEPSWEAGMLDVEGMERERLEEIRS